MLASAIFRNTITKISIISTTSNPQTKSSSSKPNSNTRFSTFQFRICATLKPLTQPQSPNPRTEFHDDRENPRTRVLLNSLRVLEWDKVCDVVSSFAGTSLGREASKEQLWALDQTYEESLKLLKETNAAVEIHKYNNALMDFTSIDALLVRSAADRACRSSPVSGPEALAVASMLQFAETLQLNIKSAAKENADLLERFMPLAELILDWDINKSLVRSILRAVDEDGSVKESASPKLKQARWRVLHLESKLNQLMSTLIANETKEVPSLEASNIDGRWCIRSGTGQLTSFQGLLLSSGSGMGNIIEPISAVPLNDELLEAKASVEDAEAEVLLDITEKIKMDLASIELLLKNMIQLDVVNARAAYGLSMRGNCPDLLLFDEKNTPLHSEGFSPEVKLADFTKKEWMLCLPKAYHPLLLQQYHHNLRQTKKDVAIATAVSGFATSNCLYL